MIIAVLLALFCAVSSPALANHIPQVDGPVTFGMPDGPSPVGRPDLMILTFNVSTSLGEIISLDLTVTGTVNQVGAFSPFEDFGDQDSHILFDPVGEGLTIQSALEDTTVLSADFSGFAPFVDRDVLQLVMPQLGPSSHYEATVQVLFPDTSTGSFSASDDIIPNFVPEPGSAALLALGLAYLGWRSKP